MGDDRVSKKRLSPEERRAQLLKMAMKAYANLGVERAGHGDVAKLAGVSTATVFNYFPTRTALTNAVLDHVESRVYLVFKELPDDEFTPAEHIVVLAETYKKLVAENDDTMKVFLNWAVSFGPDVRPHYLSFQDNVLSFIQSRLTDAEDDRSDARLILAAALSYAAMNLDHTSDEVLQRFIDRVQKAFF